VGLALAPDCHYVGPVRRLSLPLVLVVLALAPSAADAAVTRSVIDGPSADIHAFQRDAAVAPDGTAAVTYLKKDGGQDHVFVSVFEGGTWSGPQRVDTGLAQPSTRPDVAVGNGGGVVVTFLNNTNVQSAVRPGSGQPFALVPIVPTTFTNFQALVVDMSPAGVAYAAYVDFDFDLRASRLDGTTWTPVGAAHPDPAGILNNDPAKQVEFSEEGLAVASGSDGNGVVGWKEDDSSGMDQAWIRRLTGTTKGPHFRASIDELDGHAHSAFAEHMDLDADGGGNYWFVFREAFDYGGSDIPRLLARRLPLGGGPEPHTVIDALGSNPPSGAEDPSVDVNASGEALAGQRRQLIEEVWGAAHVGGSWQTFQLDPDNRTDSIPALGDSGGGALAFARGKEMIARHWAGGALGAEVVLSEPGLEGVGRAFGGADGPGNSFFAFTEETSATQRRIVVARIDEIVAPDATGTRVRPRTIAVGRRAPIVLSARRRAIISFNLSEAAAVRMTFSRATRGRRVAGQCVKNTPARRRRPRCTRYARVRGAVNFAGKAGLNRVRFEGRITRRRRLRPGRHRVTVQATDAAGNVSQQRHASFRIVRR
jgi:hypothetical protein